MILTYNYEKIYEKIFFITLAYLGIIDSLNGLLIEYFGISISIIYRMFALIIFSFFTVYKNNYKEYIPIIVIGIYLTIGSSINLIVNGYENKIIFEFIKISKIIYIFVIVESFKNIYRNKAQEGRDLIEKIINFNLIIFPLCIIIPMLFGIGMTTYDSTIGSKGFFNANNEIGLILSVLCIFAVDKIYNEVNIYNILIFIFLFISTISIGSKVGLTAPFLAIIIYFIKSIYNKNEKKKFYKLIIYSSVIIILMLMTFFNELIYEVIKRQIHFYNFYSTNDTNPILTLLLSGRNEFINIMNNAISSSNHPIIMILFGFSSFIKESIVGFNFYGQIGMKAIEMDFFDLLYSYGVVGLILVYGYIFNYICKYRCFDEKNMKYTLSLIIILVLGFLAGHVFFGAMAGSMLAIVICGMISSYEAKSWFEKSKKE